jgi:hypothetical protein
MLRRLLGVLLLGLSGLCAQAYHDRYWRWRDCFNELGRCWDSETQHVYLEQAGIVWGGLTVILLAAGLSLLVRTRNRRG